MLIQPIVYGAQKSYEKVMMYKNLIFEEILAAIICMLGKDDRLTV